MSENISAKISSERNLFVHVSEFLAFIFFGCIWYYDSTGAIEDYYIILAKQNVISC